MNMTSGQETAYKHICQWYDEKLSMVFRLGGAAGTGKSWLIPLIAEHVGSRYCLFMTPTGKAANRLIKSGIDAHTIHSQIYQPANPIAASRIKDMSVTDIYERFSAYTASDHKEEEDAVYEYKLKSPESFYKMKLFIIDEASMVGKQLLADLLTFNVPILLVGDPNQLDPINDETVFDKCDYYLTEIVRQSYNSPVIWLSQQILSGALPNGMFGNCQVRTGGISDNEFFYANQVLTDTNATRDSLNKYMRLLQFNGKRQRNLFVEGDKIICRTNSLITSDLGFSLTNGAQGTIKTIMRSEDRGSLITCSMHTDELGNFDFVGTAFPERFSPECRPPKIEYAYAITVHLSQGSEWDNVIYVLNRRFYTKSGMYTAVTRAKHSVLVAITE